MFKEFRCPENMEKAVSARYISPDIPKIINGLSVALSWKTIKFKQQMEFQSFKIIQDFKKVYMRRFFLGLAYYIHSAKVLIGHLEHSEFWLK